MKRDYTLYLACALLVVAVLVLAAPQIYRLLNPISFDSTVPGTAQPPILPFPTILPSGVISATNSISPTIGISVTETIAPIVPVSPTLAATATLIPAATISSTLIVSPTIAPSETISPTGSVSATVDARIQNFTFSPSPLTVPLGATVKWTQYDKSVPHTVSAGTPQQPNPQSKFNSGSLTASGAKTYEFTFDEPGIFPYYCIFHTEMTASVVVSDAQGQVPTSSPSVDVAATPTPFVAAPPANAQLVYRGLVNPRGFVRGPDGALYVAEAGTVPVTIRPTISVSATVAVSATNTISPTQTTVAPSPPPRATVNPICKSQLPSYDKKQAGCPGAQGPQVSNKGRISRIAPGGTRTTVAENLPVTVGPFGDVFGVNSVAFVGNTLYVILAAGATRGHPDFPTGVYLVNADGTTTLNANLEEFAKADPPKFIPEDYNYSLPYDMVSANDKLYITDGNAAVVFEVNPTAPETQRINRIVDLSPTHNVLTGITAGADGAIYFTDFTPAPYPVGGAKIFKWTPQAGLTTVTAGLSIATGIALAPDGAFYGSEFATALGVSPFIAPPGRIAHITADGTVTTFAAPFVYPTSLRLLSDGLYVTNNGVNAIDGEPGDGAIYKLPLP